jgi:hypothetical protein
MLCLPGYMFLKYVNAWIFIEQFSREIIFKRKNLVWFKPGRVDMQISSINISEQQKIKNNIYK